MKTPFNVLAKHNSWDKVPREPITIGNIILGALNVNTYYLSVIWLTGFVATTLVAGALMRALMPKPPKMQEGLLGNFRQAAAPWDVVYGQVRKGGTITYMESTGDTNKYLHMIVTLAGHEVEEIGDIYINDKVVTIDSNDEVTSEPWVSGSGGANKWITIKKFTGASNQNIYNSLQSMTDGPTFENEAATNTPSNFKGEGISCIYVRLEYSRDVFASGIPSFSAVVKGKKVYDPRTSTTGYSANAALCIRDYLVSEYGLNTLASSIDDTYFSTAANDCNTSSGSGESNKFEINGVITTSANIRTNLQDMVGACVGNLYYSAGQFKLVAGVYSPSVRTLTLHDLRSEISLNTRNSRRDNFNSVQGTFIWAGVDDGSNSGGDWTEFEYPPITSTTFVTEDKDYANPLQLDLPLTTGSATAQRIAKQTLFRAREQMSFSAEFGMNAFDLEIGDTVSLTLDRYGWDEKEFEVVSWGFKASQDAGDLRVTLGLRETSEAAFSWNAEESDIINNNTNLPNPAAGLSVANLQVSDDGLTQGDGTFINRVTLTWTAATNAYLDYYEVEWKATSDSVYNSTTTNTNSIELSPLVDGIQYTFRVRAVASNGFKGTTVSLTFTAGGDATAPGIPSSVSGYAGVLSNLITWTNPTDSDFKNTEVYSNTSNSSSGSVLVGTSAGTEFTHIGLPGGTSRYYWLKSVDFSGNKSNFSSGTGAITALGAPSDGLDGLNNATVFLYNKSSTATAPTLFSGNFTYTFSTGVLSGGTLNGWSQEPPTLAQGDNLFVSLATASSRTATDSIPSTEFSTPEITSIAGSDGTDGAPGDNGYTTATVSLFRKTSTASAPSDPTGTFTYTFSTAVLSGGTFNGWTQTSPSLSKGEYLWIIQASAYSNTSTDTIAASEFTAASIVGIAGDDGSVGAAGDTVVTGKVYYQVLQSNQPGTPSASSYNISTASFSGLTSDWSLSQPGIDITDTSIKEWSSNFTVTIDGLTSAQTIEFTSPSGAIQVTSDLESDNYVANTSGWKLERDTGDIEVNSGLFRGDITVRGDISFTNDSHTSALVGGPFGHVSSSSTINSYLDGAGLYVFVMVGGGGSGTGSDTDETSETGGGGGGGGCAIFSFDWNGSTSLYFARGNGGTWSGGGANAGTASTFSYGGSIIATANGGAGAPSYSSTGTASGGTASFNTGVVTLLSSIGRTGGSATVSAGHPCAGAGVNFFGDGGANTTSAYGAAPGGSPYGQYPSTSDTRLIMSLNRTFGFIGGVGAFYGGDDGTAYAGDGGLFSGGGSVRSQYRGEAGDGGIGGGGGGARCDGSRVAGVGGPGGLFWSKL